MNGNLILKYMIPLKEGDVKECFVFNWADSFFEPNWDLGFLKAKSNHDWTSEQKHRNTRDFIRFMRKLIKDKKAAEQLT